MRVRAWRSVLIASFVFSIALVAQIPARGQVWPNGYSYARTITIAHAEVPNTDQTNFPVLFSGTYSYLATTSNGGGVTNSNGYDIIFTSDANGLDILPFERESYNASTGAVIYWVQVPTVSHTSDTVIYLFYGNSSVTTDQSSQNGVWDSNYKGVWHLSNGSTLSGTDSTSNGYALTNNNSTAATTGEVDGAGSFNGTNNYLSNSSLSIPSGSSITISFWNYVTTAQLQNGAAFTIGNTESPNRILGNVPWSDRTLYWDYGTYTTGRASTSYNSYLGSWTYVVLEYNSASTIHSIYLNGSLAASSTNSNTPTSTMTGIDIGSFPLDSEYHHGSLDEFRVSISARSADWTATEYNNQSSPSTFYSLGSATSYGGPNISSLSPSSGNIGDSVTITGTNFGSSQGSSTVTFAGTTATPSSWSSTQIVAAVPTGAISGSVIVTVASAPSNAAHFTITGGSWSNGYSNRRTVTIDHTKVPNTDQTNFPMLFSGKYPYLATTSNGGGVTNSSGYDIVFALDAAGTTILPFEQESYDPSTGKVNYWVQVPSVSHAYDTVIFLFYGNSSISTDHSNKTGTWDSNFKGVWHMGNGTTLSAADSTANGNNGTVGGSPTAITGQISGAVNFSGSSDRFAISSISVSSVSYTISAWLNAPIPTTSGGWNTLTRGANDHEVIIRESDWQLGEYDNVGGSGFHGCGYYVNTLSTGWHYLAAVGTGSVTNFYIDGAYTCQSTKKSNDTVVSLGNYQSGTQPFGKTDEIRISTGIARSSDWIATEYNNQSFPIGFYDEGTIAITSLSPTSGYYATSVTITGRHFGSSQGTSTVSFNGIAATPTSWSDTSIVVPVPFGAGPGNVVVTVSGIASNGMNFSIFPTGWSDSDVGSVGLSGSASYGGDTFTVNGAGSAIWGTADSFNFAYQSLSGDGTIIARVVTQTSGSQAGVMIRETLTAGSRHATLALQSNNPDFLYRTTTNGNSSNEDGSNVPGLPYWLKLVRSGSSFAAYISPDGVDWTQIQSSETISMGTNVYIGLVVLSGNTSSLATAAFSNVSVTQSSSQPPVISSVSATSGSTGSQVVILGSNFGSTQSSSGVTLNGAPVTINSWSATVIDVTIPSGASTGYLVVSIAPSMDSNPVFFTVTSQALPSGWFDTDIGTVGTTGSAGYASGTFTVSGAGSGLGGTADSFHFVYQPLAAAGTIVARVSSFSSSTSSGSAGVMIRETLTAGSTETSTNFANSGSGSYYGYLNYRTSTNGTASGQQGSAGQAFVPYWLKVTRSGNTLSGYTSTDGVTWTQTQSTHTITMATNVYIGLAVLSGSTTTLATATFDHVSTYNGGEISGTITKTSGGTALSGAVIQAMQWGTVVGTATSDSSGNYGIYLSGGSYDIQVSASGYGTTVTNAVLVPVDSVTTFNASLSSPGSVSGTITQSNGVTAIQGAVVQALVGDASVASATSASNGSYTISGLNAGTYQVQATATGYVSAGQSASVTAGGTATANISLQTQSSGAVTYVYDPLGRLVGVINPSGNTAIYNYDAVGNLLSISTQSSASLSIISFAPAGGTFGTTVTIYGTGFNTTPSLNTVKFNGLAGTVNAATSTQLIVTVPIGATTGTISVTTSAGTVTSVSSFTVNP